MNLNKHLTAEIFASMRKSKSLIFQETTMSHVCMLELVGVLLFPLLCMLMIYITHMKR